MGQQGLLSEKVRTLLESKVTRYQRRKRKTLQLETAGSNPVIPASLRKTVEIQAQTKLCLK